MIFIRKLNNAIPLDKVFPTGTNQNCILIQRLQLNCHDSPLRKKKLWRSWNRNPLHRLLNGGVGKCLLELLNLNTIAANIELDAGDDPAVNKDVEESLELYALHHFLVVTNLNTPLTKCLRKFLQDSGLLGKLCFPTVHVHPPGGAEYGRPLRYQLTSG